jgi:hypothetical protein
VKPEELRQFLTDYGDEMARQDLTSLDAAPGPDPGLPDTTQARAAAEGVAEVDALVRAEKTGAATGRYRDLSGCTWDEAIGALRTWRSMTRVEKLRRLGWPPKEPPGDHPMRDRLLDG